MAEQKYISQFTGEKIDEILQRVDEPISPEKLLDSIEGDIGVSVDENEEGTKVIVALDLTGGTPGDVLTIDENGDGVEWKKISSVASPDDSSGQFLVSDGLGGSTWVTIPQANTESF